MAAPGNAGAAQSFSPDRDIPADWWTLFHDERLDELMREALKDMNPDGKPAPGEGSK